MKEKCLHPKLRWDVYRYQHQRIYLSNLQFSIHTNLKEPMCPWLYFLNKFGPFWIFAYIYIFFVIMIDNYILWSNLYLLHQLLTYIWLHLPNKIIAKLSKNEWRRQYIFNVIWFVAQNATSIVMLFIFLERI